MREIIVTGKSLEGIREEWASQWACSPEQLIIEVIEKPGVFNRSWKVKVILDTDNAYVSTSEETIVTWDGTKYRIIPGLETESILPFLSAGKLFHKAKEIQNEFMVQKGDIFEFVPEVKEGGLDWKIDIEPDGSKVTARVSHEHSGKYVWLMKYRN
jgi:hypothetical protein